MKRHALDVSEYCYLSPPIPGCLELLKKFRQPLRPSTKSELSKFGHLTPCSFNLDGWAIPVSIFHSADYCV